MKKEGLILLVLVFLTLTIIASSNQQTTGDYVYRRPLMRSIIPSTTVSAEKQFTSLDSSKRQQELLETIRRYTSGEHPEKYTITIKGQGGYWESTILDMVCSVSERDPNGKATACSDNGCDGHCRLGTEEDGLYLSKYCLCEKKLV